MIQAKRATNKLKGSTIHQKPFTHIFNNCGKGEGFPKRYLKKQLQYI